MRDQQPDPCLEGYEPGGPYHARVSQTQAIQIVINGPIAEELSAALSRVDDVDQAIALLDRLMDSTSQPDGLVGMALLSAAVTAYGRAFLRDRRQRVASSLPDELGVRAEHDRLMSLRSQHFAHHDSLREQRRILLLLAPADQEREVLGVSNFSIRQVGVEDGELRVFRALAETVRARFAADVARLSQELVDINKAIPVERTYAAAAAGKGWRPLRSE